MEKKRLKERFQDELRLRNYSPHTIRNYTSMLSLLSLYYKTSPEQLTNEQLKNYALYLIDEKKQSTSTINQLISAWKILRVDVLGHEPDEIKIKRPRRPKRLPVILSQKEAFLLVNALPNIKHRALLNLAYATGLRRSELLQLKIGDIDSARHLVRVVCGKGNKTREVTLS